jgi:hypothetical protein
MSLIFFSISAIFKGVYNSIGMDKISFLIKRDLKMISKFKK